jgi:hypothetical protein
MQKWLLALAVIAIVASAVSVPLGSAAPTHSSKWFCEGDLNHDNRITEIDLDLLLAIYGQTKADMHPLFWYVVGQWADMNDDGVVSQSDLAEMLSKLGTSC